MTTLADTSPASPTPAPPPPVPPGPGEVSRGSGTGHRTRGGHKVRRAYVVERRRPLLLRWLLRLLAFLLVLLLLGGLVVLGVTLVLRSDLPRSIAESVASSQTNLDVSIGGLDVGWRGRVTLHDLVVRLPAKRPGEEVGALVAEVPRLDAKLPFLPVTAAQAIFGVPEVEWASVESPRVHLTQDDEGNWTLLEAADLLAEGDPPPPDEPRGAPTIPILPDLRVTDAGLVVRDAGGRELLLDGLDVLGRRGGGQSYAADATAPWLGNVTATLLPQAGLRHDVKLDLDRLDDAARRAVLAFVGPNAVDRVPDVDLQARWRGRFDGPDLVGELDVTRLTVDESAAMARLSLAVRDGVTTLDLERARAVDVPGIDGTIRVAGGRVEVDGDEIRLDDLVVAVLDGVIRVGPVRFDADTLAGELRAEFRDLRPAEDVRAAGVVEASLGYGAFGEPTLDATVRLAGAAAGYALEDLHVTVAGRGEGLRDFLNGRVLIEVDPPEVYAPGETRDSLTTAGVRALLVLHGDASPPFVELRELRTTNPHEYEALGDVHANGWYAWETGHYGLWFEASSWPIPVPRLPEPLPLDLGAILAGQFDPTGPGLMPVQLVKAYGSLADMLIDASGWYVVRGPHGERPDIPLAIDVSLTRDPRTQPEVELTRSQLADGRPPAVAVEAMDLAELAELVRGELGAYLTVIGDPADMRFEGEGDFFAENLVVGDSVIGDFNLPLRARLADNLFQARIEDDGDRHVRAEVLGADLRLALDVPTDAAEPGLLTLDLVGLELRRLTTALTLSPVYGMADVNIRARVRGFDTDDVDLDGEIVARQVATAEAFVADQVTIRPRLRNGLARADVELFTLADDRPGPLRDGPVRTMELAAELDVDDPMRIAVAVRGDNYPLWLSPQLAVLRPYGEVRVSASTEWLVVDLRNDDGLPRVSGLDGGTARFEGVLAYAGGSRADRLSEVLRAGAAVTGEGTLIRLDQLRARVAGLADVNGAGQVDLLDPATTTSLFVHGRDIDLEALARELDAPEGASGILGFSLTLGPDTAPRPRGDLQLNLAFQAVDGRFRTVELRQGQIIAYASRVPVDDRPPGPFDFNLISTERVRIAAAGGTIDAYLRYRDRGREFGGRSVQATTSLDIELGQVTGLTEQNATGRLTLDARLAGSLEQPRLRVEETGDAAVLPLNGDFTVAIREGRLARFNLVRRLLQLARVVPGGPADRFDVRGRLEGGDLYYTGAEALVDGVAITSAGRVRDVFGQRFIEANAAVFWRPLSQIPLPFFRQADDIFGALQSYGTGARIRGPVEDPVVIPQALDEIGGALRALLVGRASER